MKRYNKKEKINVIIDVDLRAQDGSPVTNAHVCPSVTTKYDTVVVDYANGNTSFIAWDYSMPAIFQFKFSNN